MQTFQLFLFLFFFLLVAVGIGIVLILFDQVDTALDEDIDVGQVNLRAIKNQTFGQINDAMQVQADTIGIMLLFGMVLFMIVNAYFNKTSLRLMIIVDIFLIVFAFILAIYISQTYETLINSDSILDPFINTIPNTSKFMLNLPIIVSASGILIMIVSYVRMRRRPDQEPVLGF